MNWRKNFVVGYPWILIFYLLGVTLAAFLLPASIKPMGVAVLFALQLAVLAAFGSLDAGVLGIFNRLRFLFAFLVGVNALLPGAPTDVYWGLPSVGLQINLTGLASGLLMSAQIALVVLTTYVVRTIGDESSFINGLRSLRVAPLLAYSLDTTLALLAGSLGGRDGGAGMGNGAHGGRKGLGGWSRGGHRHGSGRGDGSGGGHGGAPDAQGDGVAAGNPNRSVETGGVLALFRALRKRDLTPLIERINQGLNDGAQHAQRLGLSESRARDVGVIGGIAALMMAFKLVKILPGMPVMQGAKTIFFIPMYILAADRTHTRWGGTIAGGIMGFIAFLNGDSRYGIFEILKHLVPGLVIDLIWPVVRRIWSLVDRLPTRVSLLSITPAFPLQSALHISLLVVVGWIAAAARTSTQFAMILALGSDNATLLVFPALKFIPNAIAGTLSALVSYPVLKHLGSQAFAERAAERDVASAPQERQPVEPAETHF